MPPVRRLDAIFRSLLEDPGWADALIRRCLPGDVAALLPEAPFAAHERAFVDDALRGTSADGVFSIRLTDGKKLYAIVGAQEHPRSQDAGAERRVHAGRLAGP